LGNLMVIAPSKMHALWYTPILPLLFLLSAIAVGFPMVIVESLYASWSLGLRSELHLLRRLAKPATALLSIYLAFKLGDLVVRGAYAPSTDGSTQFLLFTLEMLVGIVIPLGMLIAVNERTSGRWLGAAALLVVLGVALNRVNVFLVAYQPPYATQAYFPSFGEFAVTVGLLSLLVLVYRALVIVLPVLSAPSGASESGHAPSSRRRSSSFGSTLCAGRRWECCSTSAHRPGRRFRITRIDRRSSSTADAKRATLVKRRPWGLHACERARGLKRFARRRRSKPRVVRES
jgi:Ni/Fe-hydrogenase subunit HybB-like protein